MIKLTLKAARVNAGYTQREAAKELKISTKTLWQWENGLSQPKPEKIDPICALYNVKYDMLIFLSKNNAKSVIGENDD